MSEQPEKKPSFTFKDWASALVHHLYHNWPAKLLSLILAIGFWSLLVTQDPTLTREKVFNDVPISVIGAETMKRNGFVVVSGL